MARKLLLMLIFLSPQLLAAAEEQPLWDYGIGVGFVRFEQYPGSLQEREFLLPLPAFQYRGEMIRADDREGARAYLFKSSNGSIELGGGVIPGLDSDDNEARRGMDDLLWNLYLGPQFVIRPIWEIEFKVGIFQSFLSDLKVSKTGGRISEIQGIWHVDRYLEKTEAFFRAKRVQGRFGLSVKAADQEFLGTYYDVGVRDTTATRPTYQSQGGMLSWSFSYFQSVEVDKWNIYAGFSETHYDLASNTESPLHQSERNLGVFAGFSYTLGQSVRTSIPLEKTKGLLDRGSSQAL